MFQTANKLFWSFIYQAIGRPIRKTLHIIITCQQRLIFYSGKFYGRYNLLLDRIGERGMVDILKREHPRMICNYLRHISSQVQRFSIQPKISILVPVYKVRREFLEEALGSIAIQSYKNWEACIVDDASDDPEVIETIQKFESKHPGKVKFKTNPRNLHISATSNECLTMAEGEYVALLDHDDRLCPNALAEMVRFINLHDRPDILYSDERVITEKGNIANTYFFKPGWSPFLHLSVNYTTHLTVYRTGLIKEIGGFREGFEGSQDHDLMLRAVEAAKKPVVHVPFFLYQWRAHEESTARGSTIKSYAPEAGVKAVTEACQRRGRPAKIEWEPKTFHYRVYFELPDPLPLVSILIPSKNNFLTINACLNSIFEKTTYPNYEIIIIDNGSTEHEAVALFDRIEKEKKGIVRVLKENGPFNFAAFNNRGAKEASGEYLILLNNDTEVITPEWIEELLRYAQFPETGAVGCKLLYPDKRIQHAGVVLLDRLVGGHAYRFLPEDTTWYYNLSKTVRETACITAACLMISAKKYSDIGGFDEVHLPNGYSDVDCCLRLRKAGYSNVYTPYATLYHHESTSRGKEIETFERFYMIRQWGRELMNDPYLNFNLEGEHYTIRPNFPFVEIDGALFKHFLKNHDVGNKLN